MAEAKRGKETVYRKPLFTAVLEQAKKVEIGRAHV